MTRPSGRSRPFSNHRTKADEPAKAEETKTEAEQPKASTSKKGDDEDEDEDVTGELQHLDQSNIIEGGRRTRQCPFPVRHAVAPNPS